jgi:hypothetical protein
VRVPAIAGHSYSLERFASTHNALTLPLFHAGWK